MEVESRDPRLLFRAGIHTGTQECCRRLLKSSNTRLSRRIVSGKRNINCCHTRAEAESRIDKYLKKFETLQENEPYINKLITEIPNNEGMQKRFALKNSLMQKFALNQNKIVLPEDLMDSLVRETHEIYGHIGSSKIYKMLYEHSIKAKNLYNTSYVRYMPQNKIFDI